MNNLKKELSSLDIKYLTYEQIKPIYKSAIIQSFKKEIESKICKTGMILTNGLTSSVEIWASSEIERDSKYYARCWKLSFVEIEENYNLKVLRFEIKQKIKSIESELIENMPSEERKVLQNGLTYWNEQLEDIL